MASFSFGRLVWFSSGQFGIRIRVINPERLHSIELIGGQMLSLATRLRREGEEEGKEEGVVVVAVGGMTWRKGAVGRRREGEDEGEEEGMVVA